MVKLTKRGESLLKKVIKKYIKEKRKEDGKRKN